MARKRSVEQTHRGFNTGSFASRGVPTTCPVCGETPVFAKGEKRHQVLESHLLAQHKPDTPCQHEHRTDRRIEWKLDWDAILSGSPERFYCEECGFYLKA